MEAAIQYITDNDGKINSVVLPVEYWKYINCNDETEFLLQNESNKKRLLEALNRKDFEDSGLLLAMYKGKTGEFVDTQEFLQNLLNIQQKLS